MTDLERRAILGDQQAQDECTRRGIVLSCPLCGSIHTQVRHMGWENLPQAFQAGYRGECTECHAVTGAHNTEKEALADWNSRPVPPLGRCEECRHWEEGECNHPANGWDVPRRGEDEFCNRFEPKGGESDG